jgi:hypothetical protein
MSWDLSLKNLCKKFLFLITNLVHLTSLFYVETIFVQKEGFCGQTFSFRESLKNVFFNILFADEALSGFH